MTVDVAEHIEVDTAAEPEPAETAAKSIPWARWVTVSLASLAMALAVIAGYFKWQDDSARLARAAATDSVHAATDSTIALLSYHPESVDAELRAATDRLTGSFRDQYTQLVNTVVVPGAKQKHISALATVPSAASVSATENHAVVLVFVNQTTTIGNDTPTASTSTVRVTLDKVHDRWLISQFDPV